MNKKRWIALAIAIGVCVAGLAILLATPQNDLLDDEEILQEVVLEEGAADEKIALLEVNGTILSSSGGLLDSETYNHSFFLAALDKVMYDDGVEAVLLKVNSPGGGVYESAEISRKIKQIQEVYKKPVYVTMEGTAASGGYYISASADKIFATEETMTGSIGVIMSSINYTGLLDKLGVKDTTYKSGKMKDAGSGKRPETEEDREMFQTMIDRSYERFVKIVADGRNMKQEKVKEIADGSIYDGGQAKELDLIDEIGFPENALLALRSDYGLEDAMLIQYDLPESTLFQSLFSASAQSIFHSKSQLSASEKLLQSLAASEGPRMMYLYGGE